MFVMVIITAVGSGFSISSEGAVTATVVSTCADKISSNEHKIDLLLDDHRGP